MEELADNSEKSNNITKGILFLITSAFFFALMAVFVKFAGDIHFIQKAFFRNAVAFIIALGGTIKDVRLNGKEAVAIPKGALLYLFLRAIAGSIGVFGNFYAIVYSTDEKTLSILYLRFIRASTRDEPL